MYIYLYTSTCLQRALEEDEHRGAESGDLDGKFGEGGDGGGADDAVGWVCGVWGGGGGWLGGLYG